MECSRPKGQMLALHYIVPNYQFGLILHSAIDVTELRHVLKMHQHCRSQRALEHCMNNTRGLGAPRTPSLVMAERGAWSVT